MIEQNIVFVENKPGSLKKVTSILADAGVNIYGFACFDYPEYALFRMVCSNSKKAEQVLSDHGYMTRITNAIIVRMTDEVGGLDELLAVIADSNVSLNYIYTSFYRKSFTPVVILHSEDISVTEGLLKYKGYEVLEHIEDLEA